MTQQEEVYNEIKGHVLSELRFWLDGIKAGVPVGVFERRVLQIAGWTFTGGEGDQSVLEEFAKYTTRVGGDGDEKSITD